MEYHVFVPMRIFLPPHQLLSHRYLLKRQGSITFSLLAIKAVVQQRHSPNQGTLVSRMVVKQSCLFCTSRGHQTRAPKSGNPNHFIFISKYYEVTIGHTRLASMTGHLVWIPDWYPSKESSRQSRTDWQLDSEINTTYRLYQLIEEFTVSSS